MATKNKAKVMTLRQRIRAQAGDKLKTMLDDMHNVGADVLTKHNSNINSYELMRILSSAQSSSLRNKVITDLANEIEAKLEELYNSQQELPGTSDD